MQYNISSLATFKTTINRFITIITLKINKDKLIRSNHFRTKSFYKINIKVSLSTLRQRAPLNLTAVSLEEKAKL